MAIEFHETMAGSFHLIEHPFDERSISFSLVARTHDFRSWGRSSVLDITGEIDAEGFADNRLLRGTLTLDLLRNGTMSYAVRFLGNDEQPYLFEGKKVVSALAFARTMSSLPGIIVSASSRAEVARALLRFDLQRDAIKFLRSFRLV